jgi:hypothetical protein
MNIAVVSGLVQETVVTLIGVAAIESVHVLHFFDERYLHDFDELRHRKVGVFMVNIARQARALGAGAAVHCRR